MERIFKELFLWGGLAILFFWLQTSHLLNFGINPNWLILGLALAWGSGRLLSVVFFTIFAVGVYSWTLPFSFMSVIIFLCAGIVMGLIVKFLTGTPLVDEVLVLALGILFLNTLFFWQSGNWLFLNVAWEILVTEIILFIGWPIFRKIR
jgi:hypothetical protein